MHLGSPTSPPPLRRQGVQEIRAFRLLRGPAPARPTQGNTEVNMAEKKLKHVWMIEERAASDEQPAATFWTKIGVATENNDGSWNLQLAAIPVSGKMQVRDPAPPSTNTARGGSR
jgi:hypothetical protein